MSDDDFFDSPRRGGAPKKYSWSREETSGKVATENNKKVPPGGLGSKAVGGSPAKAESDNGSETERSERPRRSKASSNQGSVTKIPTGKSQEYSRNSTDDDYSSDEEETGRRSRSKGKIEKGSRSGSSRSRSNSYTGSSSRSRSRSASSASDGDRKGGSKQAWGVESKSQSKDKNSSSRPKTGHHGRRSQRSRSSSAERRDTSKPKSHHKENSDDSSSLSETESSDSDMTDVSPLNSPHKETPKKTKRVEICESPLSEKRPPHSPMHKDLYSYSGKKARPKSAHAGGYEHLLQADKDSVNLKVLMQAILEMERDKEEQSNSAHRKFRVQHHAPSIAGSVSSQSSISSRRNYSFTNSRVKDIDRENQRLMKQILRQNLKKTTRDQAKPKKQPMTATQSQRLTSSAVNRMKEQQRIDQENRAMLRRLEGAKATKTLQRDALNHELNNTTYVGVPLGVIHAPKQGTGRTSSGPPSPYGVGPRSGSAPPGTRRRRPGSAVSHRSDATSVLSDATSQMSFGSSASTLKSKRSTGSGKPRPKSAHVMSGTRTVGGVVMKSSRPDWEAGW